MGTTPICLQAIFVLAWENRWKIANLNSTIKYTSTDRSEKNIACFSLEKIANVNKLLLIYITFSVVGLTYNVSLFTRSSLYLLLHQFRTFKRFQILMKIFQLPVFMCTFIMQAYSKPTEGCSAFINTRLFIFGYRVMVRSHWRFSQVSDFLGSQAIYLAS